MSKVSCDKCEGAGWLWFHELNSYDGPGNETGIDDTKYTCDKCDGEGDICCHSNLRFGSGGYYIFCDDCGVDWCAGDEKPREGNEKKAQAGNPEGRIISEKQFDEINKEADILRKGIGGFVGNVLKVCKEYEFNARDCGDRKVIKLSGQELIDIIAAVDNSDA